jgi:hypothetical protein
MRVKVKLNYISAKSFSVKVIKAIPLEAIETTVFSIRQEQDSLILTYFEPLKVDIFYGATAQTCH